MDSLVIENQNLTVKQHSIFSFLRPHRTGKVITMKIWLKLIKPNRSGGKIFGYDIVRDSVAIRNRVAYLPQQPCFAENMPAREKLYFSTRFFFSGPRPQI